MILFLYHYFITIVLWRIILLKIIAMAFWHSIFLVLYILTVGDAF